MFQERKGERVKSDKTAQFKRVKGTKGIQAILGNRTNTILKAGVRTGEGGKV